MITLGLTNSTGWPRIFLGISGVAICVGYTAAVYQCTEAEFRAHHSRNPETPAGFSL